MFAFFKKKPDPPTAPAVPAYDTPPAPPGEPLSPPEAGAQPRLRREPRKHHHEMTHDFMREGFIGKNRAKFLGMLFRKDLQEIMRTGWDLLGKNHGADAVDPAGLAVSIFQHDSRLCAFFEFPRPVAVGEASLGLVVAGPSTAWSPENLDQVPVRYFVLEAALNHSTVVKECLPEGYVKVGPGPGSGSAITAFSGLCFEHISGKQAPTAEEAARRLCVLKQLSTYAHAKILGKQLYDYPALPAAAKAGLGSIMGDLFVELLKKQNIWDSASKTEQQFFESPVEALTEPQVLNASWRHEAAQTLMWALGLTASLPAYDTPAGPDILKQLPEADITAFCKSARLRDANEIAQARKVAELWHWRSRTRQLVQAGHLFQPTESLRKAGVKTLDDVIRIAAHTAAEAGEIPPCIGDDFPAHGKAYRDLTDEEWAMVRSISAERHFTLNWLCAYAPLNDWDETPTET